MSHYYDEHQEGPYRPETLTFSYKNRTYHPQVSGGVFSRKRLDIGTTALLDNCDVHEEDDVLDLGCGWGAVGLILKTTHPRITLTMSDVNERAIRLAKQNLEMKEAKIIRSDGYEKITGHYTVILLNPPMAAGRETCKRLIKDSKEHLAQGGRLQVVARHQKGGKALQAYMEDVFGNVTTLGKQSGFRVYQSIYKD